MRENALGVLWYTVVFMIICFLHELVFHYKLSSYRRRENRRYVHATDVCVCVYTVYRLVMYTQDLLSDFFCLAMALLISSDLHVAGVFFHQTLYVSIPVPLQFL